MMGPSLKTTAAVSLTIHIVFFATIVVIMNSHNHYIRPVPYVVRLVGSDAGNFSSTAAQTTDAPAQTQKSSDQAQTSLDSKTVSDNAKEYAEDRIAVLKAKKKAAEAVKLRTTIISLKGSIPSNKTTTDASQSTGSGGGSGGSLETNYIIKIGEEIRQHWAFPEIKGKDFEAIIAVTIMKDGTIIMHNIEKSSGDSLFDGSALRAIKKASPVTPPPYEMNFGMRFTP